MSISETIMKCSNCGTHSYSILYQHFDHFLCQRCFSTGALGSEKPGWKVCSRKIKSKIKTLELKKKVPSPYGRKIPYVLHSVDHYPLNAGLSKIESKPVKPDAQKQMPFGLARVLIEELLWTPDRSLETVIRCSERTHQSKTE